MFEGKINFLKTKAEIVKEVGEQQKGTSKNAPEIIDVIRNLPDRRYNDEADLDLGIEQQEQQKRS